MGILIKCANNVYIFEHEVSITAIRAQGPGGQHVNKASTAIQLQFDIMQSSLSEYNKQRVMACGDYRISTTGLITIKAQRYRSQDQNRRDALSRLELLITKSLKKPKKRIATKPSKAAKEKRLQQKKIKSQLKKTRVKRHNSDY